MPLTPHGVENTLAAVLADAAAILGVEDERAALRTAVVGRLDSAAKDAAETEGELLYEVLAATNLIIECVRSALPRDKLKSCLAELAKSLGADALRGYVLYGPGVELEADVDDEQLGCSLMRWDAFCEHYAALYGVSPADPVETEKLWQRLRRGELLVPVRDLHFDGALHVVWFTDRAALAHVCPTADGGIDGGRAYDHLGLDWTNRWEIYDDETDTASSRAVLLSCPLAQRANAERGLCLPTAVEAWGNLLFVPGDASRRGPWPEVGSFTVEPLSGAPSLPEGVHGPLDVAPDDSGLAEAVGEVTKGHGGDRLEECGSLVARRALDRLRDLLREP
jgi:hypothetical protein